MYAPLPVEKKLNLNYIPPGVVENKVPPGVVQ